MRNNIRQEHMLGLPGAEHPSSNACQRLQNMLEETVSAI